MSDKVSCKSCGVMILESTAQRTSGVCMPCKNGYREHIEKARAYYARERELEAHSPLRALWRDLVERVHNGSGFESLSEDEKLYFAVSVLRGEVYNGGFVQFFHNTSGKYFRSAESGLQLVGATRSLELLRQAKWVMSAKRTSQVIKRSDGKRCIGLEKRTWRRSTRHFGKTPIS